MLVASELYSFSWLTFVQLHVHDLLLSTWWLRQLK